MCCDEEVLAGITQRKKRRALSFLHCFVYGGPGIVVPQRADFALAHLQSSMRIYTSRPQCAC